VNWRFITIFESKWQLTVLDPDDNTLISVLQDFLAEVDSYPTKKTLRKLSRRHMFSTLEKRILFPEKEDLSPLLGRYDVSQ